MVKRKFLSAASTGVLSMIVSWIIGTSFGLGLLLGVVVALIVYGAMSKRLPVAIPRDVRGHIQELFSRWMIGGRIDSDILAAFDTILAASGDPDPKSTIGSWMKDVKSRTAEALNTGVIELGFMDVENILQTGRSRRR